MKKYLTLTLITALVCSCSTKKITTKTDITNKTITATDSSSVSSTSDRTLIDLSKRITITEHITETIAEVKDSTGRIVSPAKTVNRSRKIIAEDANITVSERDSSATSQVSQAVKSDVKSSTTEVVRRSSFSWGWVCFWLGVVVLIGVRVRRYLF